MVTGEKGPVTGLEPWTYTLSQSFSHELPVPAANPSSLIVLCTSPRCAAIQPPLTTYTSRLILCDVVVVGSCMYSMYVCMCLYHIISDKSTTVHRRGASLAQSPEHARRKYRGYPIQQWLELQSLVVPLLPPLHIKQHFQTCLFWPWIMYTVHEQWQ